MKLCIVSDIHGSYKAHTIIKRIVPDADIYVDCGDSECSYEQIQKLKEDGWICVRGNMDYISNLEDKEYFTLAGFRFLVMHGNRITYRTFDEDVDIILRGHTHVYRIEEYNKKTMINPGSYAKPRDYDMTYGYGEFCIMNIDNDKHFECERIIINLEQEYNK